MEANYIFILHENNPEYDDITRLEMYDTENQESMGYIDFEKKFIDDIGVDYGESVAEGFYSLSMNAIDKVIYLTTFKIHREYRYQSYGKLLMKEFLTCTLPLEFPEFEIVYLFPDSIDNDTQLENWEYREMLQVFYGKFGFSIMPEEEYFMVKNLWK